MVTTVTSTPGQSGTNLPNLNQPPARSSTSNLHQNMTHNHAQIQQIMHRMNHQHSTGSTGSNGSSGSNGGNSSSASTCSVNGAVAVGAKLSDSDIPKQVIFTNEQHKMILHLLKRLIGTHNEQQTNIAFLNQRVQQLEAVVTQQNAKLKVVEARCAVAVSQRMHTNRGCASADGKQLNALSGSNGNNLNRNRNGNGSLNVMSSANLNVNGNGNLNRRQRAYKQPKFQGNPNGNGGGSNNGSPGNGGGIAQNVDPNTAKNILRANGIELPKFLNLVNSVTSNTPNARNVVQQQLRVRNQGQHGQQHSNRPNQPQNNIIVNGNPNINQIQMRIPVKVGSNGSNNNLNAASSSSTTNNNTNNTANNGQDGNVNGVSGILQFLAKNGVTDLNAANLIQIAPNGASNGVNGRQRVLVNCTGSNVQQHRLNAMQRNKQSTANNVNLMRMANAMNRQQQHQRQQQQQANMLRANAQRNLNNLRSVNSPQMVGPGTKRRRLNNGGVAMNNGMNGGNVVVGNQQNNALMNQIMNQMGGQNMNPQQAQLLTQMLMKMNNQQQQQQQG